MGVYIVKVRIECIKNDNLKKQNVSRVSWEGLTRETLAKTSYLHPVLTVRIPITCRAHASLRGKLTRELAVKTTLVFN